MGEKNEKNVQNSQHRVLDLLGRGHLFLGLAEDFDLPELAEVEVPLLLQALARGLQRAHLLFEVFEL